MHKALIHVPSIRGRNYRRFIRCLSRHFKDWKFEDRGAVARLKDSVHFHVRSRSSTVKGVLELTFAPSLGDAVELKIADGRRTAWSIEAQIALVQYLEDLKWS